MAKRNSKFEVGERVTVIPMNNREQMARIVDEAMKHGDPRSNIYRLGALDLLCRRSAGSEFPNRFKMGTVEADAYWAGVERGWMIWRRLEHVTVEEDFAR